jgi:predicted nucleic acid-binding protein
VKFWDTSALVPLVLDEPSSRSMRQLLSSDANVAVSFISGVELQSAIARRTGNDEPHTRLAASQFVVALSHGWTVADDYVQIVAGGKQVASRYGLRAGDAIQLASALSLGHDARMPFVTLDQELRAAARAEGFLVLP